MPRDQVPAANVPRTFNKTLITAGVEDSQVLNTPGTDAESLKGIQIKSKTTTDVLQYSFESGGPYTTIPGGYTYAQGNLDIRQAFSVYLKGAVNNQVAEIEIWR